MRRPRARPAPFGAALSAAKAVPADGTCRTESAEPAEAGTAWTAGIADAGVFTRSPNQPLYQKEKESPARTTRGTHMLGGDSWAWSNLWRSFGSPRNVRITSRNM